MQLDLFGLELGQPAVRFIAGSKAPRCFGRRTNQNVGQQEGGYRQDGQGDRDSHPFQSIGTHTVLA